MMRWLAWLVLAACGAAVPPLPSQGGPAWIEVESDHFTLWTDADAGRADELIQQMEHARSVIYGAVFPSLPAGGRVFVVALRTMREAREFVPQGFEAFALPPRGSAIRQPQMVMPGDANGDRLVITHELTHAISSGAVHDQPHWFSEGLARFFETMDVDEAGHTVDLGRPNPDIVRQLATERLERAAELFACQSLACIDYRFYASAWAVFAYLWNKHPAELAKLEAAFDTMPPDAAWHAAFPDVALAQLDRDVATWLTSGGHKIWSYKIDLRVWPTRRRALGDADVHSVRALISLDARRATEADAALAIDPTNVVALAVRMAIDKHAPPLAAARAAAAAHPDSWQAWAMLAGSARGDEAAAAGAKACTLAAQNPALFVPPCH